MKRTLFSVATSLIVAVRAENDERFLAADPYAAPASDPYASSAGGSYGTGGAASSSYTAASTSSYSQPTYSTPEPVHETYSEPSHISSSSSSRSSNANADFADDDVEAYSKAELKDYPCYQVDDQGLYDFRGLQNFQEDWSATTTSGDTISFNFCKLVDTSSCSNDAGDVFAILNKGGDCQPLTNGNIRATLTESTSNSLGKDGIRIERIGNQPCPTDDSRTLGFTIDVICNKEANVKPMNIHVVRPNSEDDDIDDRCVQHVMLESSAGCPSFNFLPLLRVMGLAMIISGVVLAYLGRKVQKQFMALLVQLVCLGILIAYFFHEGYLAIADPTEPPKRKSVLLGFVAIIASIIAAIISRWLFKKFLKFGPLVIGMFFGYLVAIYLIVGLNGMADSFAAQEKGPGAAGAEEWIGESGQMLYTFFGIVLGGYVGWNYALIFILAVQTFVSSYLIVRGLSLWINYGYPNEAVLIQSVYAEDSPHFHVPPTFYAYLAAILALWAYSFRYAYKKMYEDGEKMYVDDSD